MAYNFDFYPNPGVAGNELTVGLQGQTNDYSTFDELQAANGGGAGGGQTLYSNVSAGIINPSYSSSVHSSSHHYAPLQLQSGANLSSSGYSHVAPGIAAPQTAYSSLTSSSSLLSSSYHFPAHSNLSSLNIYGAPLNVGSTLAHVKPNVNSGVGASESFNLYSNAFVNDANNRNNQQQPFLFNEFVPSNTAQPTHSTTAVAYQQQSHGHDDHKALLSSSKPIQPSQNFQSAQPAKSYANAQNAIAQTTTPPANANFAYARNTSTGAPQAIAVGSNSSSSQTVRTPTMPTPTTYPRPSASTSSAPQPHAVRSLTQELARRQANMPDIDVMEGFMFFSFEREADDTLMNSFEKVSKRFYRRQYKRRVREEQQQRNEQRKRIKVEAEAAAAAAIVAAAVTLAAGASASTVTAGIDPEMANGEEKKVDAASDIAETKVASDTNASSAAMEEDEAAAVSGDSDDEDDLAESMVTNGDGQQVPYYQPQQPSRRGKGVSLSRQLAILLKHQVVEAHKAKEEPVEVSETQQSEAAAPEPVAEAAPPTPSNTDLLSAGAITNTLLGNNQSRRRSKRPTWVYEDVSSETTAVKLEEKSNEAKEFEATVSAAAAAAVSDIDSSSTSGRRARRSRGGNQQITCRTLLGPPDQADEITLLQMCMGCRAGGRCTKSEELARR